MSTSIPIFSSPPALPSSPNPKVTLVTGILNAVETISKTRQASSAFQWSLIALTPPDSVLINQLANSFYSEHTIQQQIVWYRIFVDSWIRNLPWSPNAPFPQPENVVPDGHLLAKYITDLGIELPK